MGDVAEIKKQPTWIDVVHEVKYGHELEKKYLGEDEHADNHGIGAGL